MRESGNCLESGLSTGGVPVYVDHFCRDTFTGGAGIAACRIARVVAGAGAHVRLFHHASAISDPQLPCRALGADSFPNAVKREFLRPFYYGYWGSHLFLRPKTLSIISPTPTYVRVPCPAPAGTPRIIHLHWIGRDLFQWRSFLETVPRDTPIVWTMHDANPVTGGCHYPETCTRYRTGCGNCPQLGRRHPWDMSHVGLREKMRALEGRPLHLLAPSGWVERLARESLLGAMATSITRMPLPIDTQSLFPDDRQACRDDLGIPSDAQVLVFGAENTRLKIKGADLLARALPLLASQRNLHAVIFGKADAAPFRASGVQVHEVGYIGDLPRLRKVLSAADLFILPSREDNCPQTGLEAMACGLPVVAFETGGIPDFVVPGQTGFLASEQTAEALAREVDAALADQPRLGVFSRNARRMIEDRYSCQVSAQAHMRFYRSLLSVEVANDTGG